ncbi:MAG: glycogen/starch/alpha-glucan family phosphorylase, partial [Firmicutes bacterium]|nr:glycogen/starch/alpha-glucan family phosphorylase [Candidatus Scybalomonas excrementavium]
MEQALQHQLEQQFGKGIKEASKEEIYTALLCICKDKMQGMEPKKSKRKLYYISAEFLIGKLLSNNLINLGVFEETREILKKYGHDITAIEEVELEPSLGNGGLGRLAACFLDSIATLGLNGDGVGLNYHEGLFLQKFRNNKQNEEKNPWITDNSWLTRTETSFEVPFKEFTMKSVMYDIDVPGYNGGCNKLHLFDADSVDESIIEDGITFNKEEIQKNITLFLYPDDSDEAGHLLRIYQQYFMVSNAAQLILKEAEDRGVDLYRLHEHVCVQINDTHPTMVIPELIRLLTQRGFNMDTAIDVVRKTCSYTNHTILAEALEKWPISYLEKVVPHLLPIIRELDERVRKDFKDEKVYIIDEMDRVHMAHIDIHYGYAVNGVAALHTKILKESELKPFYDIYPEKFNNKTNGITFRRWLVHCNHKLADYLKELVGEGYLKNAQELERLLQYENDETVLANLKAIKKEAKIELKKYLKMTQNIEIDENSIFDIQIKRLHEYKRQQMNALYAIYKYKEIKNGNLPKRKITMIFGAKAAPAYIIAKDIIHLILCLQQLIANDKEVSPYLQIVMVENYNVTKAEKLIPACDISEQISLASKEASGTGNMKFMLNGAITLGTEDGANVEIHELVGDDNIYIFGEKSEEVIKLYETGKYCSKDIYEADKVIHELVDFIISKELIQIGDSVNLERLHKEIVGKDWFMTLLDVKDYIKTKERMLEDYEDEKSWEKKMLV